MKNKRKLQSGFGLIEVIVSITIMTMVVLALNALARSAYYSWENASNKAVAYNLIQEEIEHLHNIRDTNVVTSGNIWSTGIEKPPLIDKSVTIENRVYNEVVTIEDLYVDLGSGLQSGLKKKVTIEVSWQERLGLRSLRGVTYLTDWKPRY
jgi:prepilin-type N-terminal cleavage/methylation domain-containing protein